MRGVGPEAMLCSSAAGWMTFSTADLCCSLLCLDFCSPGALLFCAELPGGLHSSHHRG
jgi:hypothetical protein